MDGLRAAIFSGMRSSIGFSGSMCMPAYVRVNELSAMYSAPSVDYTQLLGKCRFGEVGLGSLGTLVPQDWLGTSGKPDDSLILSAQVNNLKDIELVLPHNVHQASISLPLCEQECLNMFGYTVNSRIAEVNKLIELLKERDIVTKVYLGHSWGRVSEKYVAELAGRVMHMGAEEIVLEDSLGLANPGSVFDLLVLAESNTSISPLSVRFNNLMGQALPNVLSALDVGVASFESSIGGIGGPMGSSSGNLPTEDLVYILEGSNVSHCIDLGSLFEALNMANPGGTDRPSTVRLKKIHASNLALEAIDREMGLGSQKNSKKKYSTKKMSIPAKNPLAMRLQGKTIESVTSVTQNMLTIAREASVGELLAELDSRKLLAAPVMDGTSVVGFVDVLDAACALVKGTDIQQTSVGDLVNFSAADAYIPILGLNPLTYMVEVFATGSHRALVLKDGSQAVLSQSDVVKFLASDLSSTDVIPFVSQTLEQLGLGSRPVICVSASDSVAAALKLIGKNTISAVGVIDSNGKLVGDFSASELRGGLCKLELALQTPVGEFSGKRKFHAVGVDATLGELLGVLADQRLHRVWLTGITGKPIGLVSLTDLLKFIGSYGFFKSVEYVFNTPMIATITIHRAHSLITLGDIFATVSKGGVGVHVTSVVKGTADPVWSEEVTSFVVDPKCANENIVFGVFDDRSIDKSHYQHSLGIFTINVGWILNGFGTGQAINNFTDRLHLRNDRNQGQLEVSILLSEQ